MLLRSVRPFAGAPAIVAAVAFGAVWAALAAGCGSSSHATAPTTAPPPTAVPHTVPPTAPPTTKKPTPPTTVWVATALQPSPDAASGDLISDWAAADKAGALTVATPAAVAALFAAPYPGGAAAIPRGCSDNYGIVCTYGPPGGGNPNDALFQLTMVHAAAGWYVYSVAVLG